MEKYEINKETAAIVGINEKFTKIVEKENDYFINDVAYEVMDYSCKYFGSSLNDRVNTTKRLINIKSKSPIIVEESRNIIFFPLKSVRDKSNIWISYNNLEKYVKLDDRTKFIFNNKKEIILDFSYYIIDNQVTRSLMLDYEVKKRRESLKK